MNKTIKQFKNRKKWELINDRIYYFGIGFSICGILFIYL